MATECVFEKLFTGSTGDPPVPSGDSPDGTGATDPGNAQGFFATLLAAVPIGESPTGAGGPSPRRSGFGHAGGSPAPPIFKTGSEAGPLPRFARRYPSSCPSGIRTSVRTLGITARFTGRPRSRN